MNDADLVLTACSHHAADIKPVLLHWLSETGTDLVKERFETRRPYDRARLVLRTPREPADLRSELNDRLDRTRRRAGLSSADHDVRWKLARPRDHLILVVSGKETFAATELLARRGTPLLGGTELAGVASNHPGAGTLPGVDGRSGVPFACIPISQAPEARDRAEQELVSLIRATRVNLVVLALYMWVLNPWVTKTLADEGIEAINLHPADTIAAAGARAAQQTLDRGIGHYTHTVHFVTAVLDAVPIIAQEHWRIDAGANLDDLARMGRRGACLVADAARDRIQGRLVVVGSAVARL